VIEAYHTICKPCAETRDVCPKCRSLNDDESDTEKQDEEPKKIDKIAADNNNDVV
jgi:Uncharacterized conserved protein (DUF2039)